MKKLISIFIIACFYSSFSQELTTQDSIRVFYDSLVYQLKENYLYTETTNWELVNPIIDQALQSQSFGASLSHCVPLFDTIQGSHLNIFSDYGWFKWSKGRQYVRADFSEGFLDEYEKYPDNNPGFQVKVLDGKYGYILMPGMLMIDLPQDSINLEAQRMYDEIMKVAQTETLEGWILDLRFNIGGNVFPMLAALYHFLGDNSTYLSLDQEGTVSELVMLDNGKIYDSRKEMAAIVPKSESDTKVPIAIITGIITASSGELVALSFQGREKVITIGEPTAGMLTGNNLTQLPFDVKLTLTSGYLANRKAKYQPFIEPQISVVQKANFEDLRLDPNVVEAYKFFKSLDGYEIKIR